MKIPFHKAHTVGTEKKYLDQAFEHAQFSGVGVFTKKSEAWLEQSLRSKKALLVTSGTTALDMAALIADIKPGDEVIMPSYTFVATATAFVLRGATPVFVDVRPDTLNIDENLIEKAITAKTKAIAPVHYAGVGCEMETICEIARAAKVSVIEDAAQCLEASYKGQKLGTWGRIGTLSFHATKNVHCGEGGAVIVDPDLYIRAEVAREKGTNRSQFFRGEVDRYTWVDMGSSFAPSELNAAFLLAQLEQAQVLTERRLRIWTKYFEALRPLEEKGVLSLSKIPKECDHNAHIFYFILPTAEKRASLFSEMKEKGIGLSAHYVPLHSSPVGSKKGRVSGELKNTDWAYNGLLRLPLWFGIEEHQDQVIEAIYDWARKNF